MGKQFLVAALIIVTISLGFLRDYIFVSINHTIDLGGNTEGKLSAIKWILTFLFSLLYLLNTGVFLFILFRSKKYIRIAIILYGILFGVSFIAASLGYFFTSFENTYHFIRTVMGVAQSPIVMMILIAACYLDIKLSQR